MNQQKDLTIANSIATSLLAFLLTIPMHELFHMLTCLAYGEDVQIFAATWNDDNTSCSIANISNSTIGSATHGAKHTTCQGIARQLCQQFTTAGIDGDVGTLLYDVLGVTLNMATLTEQSYRLISCL